ncbi:hypothetical protein Ae201684P_017669 [Aphanomyces euteiches]|nr:hypothetical protein Ae201684P_017669 [Aphanomyces euteiches]
MKLFSQPAEAQNLNCKTLQSHESYIPLDLPLAIHSPLVVQERSNSGYKVASFATDYTNEWYPDNREMRRSLKEFLNDDSFRRRYNIPFVEEREIALNQLQEDMRCQVFLRRGRPN